MSTTLINLSRIFFYSQKEKDSLKESPSKVPIEYLFFLSKALIINYLKKIKIYLKKNSKKLWNPQQEKLFIVKVFLKTGHLLKTFLAFEFYKATKWKRVLAFFTPNAQELLLIRKVNWLDSWRKFFLQETSVFFSANFG